MPLSAALAYFSLTRRELRATMAAPMPASWPLYFGEDYTPDDRRAELTAELAGFFSSGPGWPLLRSGAAVAPGRQHVALALDYTALASGTRSPNLVASLEVQPTEGLACIAAAAHEVGERGREGRKRDAPRRFERSKKTAPPPPDLLSLSLCLSRSSSTPAPPTARPPSASPPRPPPPPPLPRPRCPPPPSGSA